MDSKKGERRFRGSREGGDCQHLINQRRDSGSGEEEIHLENREERELTGLESCCDVRINGTRRAVTRMTARFLA